MNEELGIRNGIQVLEKPDAVGAHDGRTFWKELTSVRKSAFVSHPDLTVEYPVRKWVKPHIKCSCLFVFEAKHQAVDYARKMKQGMRLRDNDYPDPLVVPCHIRGPRKISMSMFFYLSISSFVKFWKEKQAFDPSINQLPNGTIGAAEVYCLE